MERPARTTSHDSFPDTTRGDLIWHHYFYFYFYFYFLNHTQTKPTSG